MWLSRLRSITMSSIKDFTIGGSGIASTTLARSNGGTTVEPEI